MPITRRTTLALVAVTALSACGFHLRGSDNRSALPFKTIHLNVADTSPLGNELKRYIRASGSTKVVSDPKQAEASLDVLSELREKQVLALNSAGRVREYALYYKLRFQVRDPKQKILMPPTDIVLKRDISFNESEVMAKESEETLLYRDMQSDMVQQILRRLAALKPAAAG